MSAVNRIIFNILFIIIMLKMDVNSHEKNPEIIYILHWTRGDVRPYESWKPKRQSFTHINCKYQNCYLTNNRNYFKNVTSYDVIIFNSLYTIKGDMDFPPERTDDQMYLFASPESSANYPAKYGNILDGLFNYTWTYRLSSEIPYPYIIVRDKSNGNVIAPKEKVDWLDVADMAPLSEAINMTLRGKSKAVAWFASNCVENSPRYEYVLNLRDELANYNLDLDIYGPCGPLDCPREQMDTCLRKIESDYYFYLAFENSFCEDYVTEKVLTALNHFAVPVVMGGANYSRFMPDGIYIDARYLREDQLAKTLNEIINDKQEYYEFFKWHRYYSYHESWQSADTDPFCALCAFLNGDWRSQRRVYANFTDWWNKDQFLSLRITNAFDNLSVSLNYDVIVHYNVSNLTTRYMLKTPKPYEVSPNYNDSPFSYIKTSVWNGIGEFIKNLYKHFFQ